jgi:hypothetical protein
MILASSVLEKVISILPRILLSRLFQEPHIRLKKLATALEELGRDGGRPSEGDPIGE